MERLEDRINLDITLVGVPGAVHAPSPLAFDGFDNPSVVLVDFDGDGIAAEDGHPNFGRSLRAIEATEATADHNPTSAANPLPFGNEGPWSAHYLSPVIDCSQC
jgi:hypothetical protein